MAETKKRARKSKLEVRDFVELDETVKTVLQSSDEEDTLFTLVHQEVQPPKFDNAKTTPSILKKIRQKPEQTLMDHTYAILSTTAPLQISVKVEVEELDESAVHNDPKMNHKEPCIIPKKQPKRKATSINAFEVDIDAMLKVADTIYQNSTNYADKYLSVELKNVWGRALRINEEEDPHEKLIQTALLNWSFAMNSAKTSKDSPLFYQCHICYLAWWHLEPFREHIRSHDSTTLKVYNMVNYCDSFIVASNHVSLSPIYISCPGDCYRCGNPYNFHIIPNKNMYKCQHCDATMSSCSETLRHRFSCPGKPVCPDTQVYGCNICYGQFYIEEVDDHVSTAHSVRSDMPTQFAFKTCSHCQKLYHQYFTHMCKNSSLSQPCPYCYRKFFSKVLQDLHISMGEQNYKCKICNMMLKMKCMETQHMLTHTNKYRMAYKCISMDCKQTMLFTDEKSVKVHIILQHNRKHDKRRAFHEKVIVPAECIRPFLVHCDQAKITEVTNDTASTEQANSSSQATETPCTDPDWCVPLVIDVQTVRQTQDDPTDDNVFEEEEPLEIESHILQQEDSGDDCAMDYAEMLSKVFKVSNSSVSTPRRPKKTSSKGKKQRAKPKNQTTKTQSQLTSDQIQSKTTEIQPATTQIQPTTTQIQPETIQIQPTKTQIQPTTSQIQPETIQIQPKTTQNETKIPQTQTKTTKIRTKTTQNETNITQIQPKTIQIQPTTTQNETNTPQTQTTKIQPKTIQKETKTTQIQPKTPQIQPKTPQIQPITYQIQPIIYQIQTTTPQGSLEPQNLPQMRIQTEIKTEPIDFESLIEIQDNPIVIKQEPIEACLGSSFSNDSCQTVSGQNDTCQTFSSQNDTQPGSAEIPVGIKTEPMDDDDESQENLDFNNDFDTDLLAVKMEPEDIKQELMECDENTDSTEPVLATPRDTRKRDAYKMTSKKRQKITLLSPSENGLKLKKLVKKNQVITTITERDVGPDSDPTVKIITTPDSSPNEKKAKRKSVTTCKIKYDIYGRKTKRVYQCTKCGYTQCHKLFKIHKKTNCEFVASGSLIFKCTKCETSFDSLKSYLHHFLKHGYGAYDCPSCNMNFEKLRDLIAHFHYHIKVNYVFCWMIKENLEEPTKKQHRCQTCREIVEPENFFSHFESHLKLSARNSHAVSEPDLPDVDTVLTGSKKQLTPAHLKTALHQLRVETQEKKCHVCRHQFSRRHDMKRHLIEHLLTDAYSKKDSLPTNMLRCQLCRAEFARAEQYKFHMREHGALPVYRCELCNKTFSDSSNFAKHKKIHNMRVMICDICRKKFHAKSTLEKHMIIHLTTDPIICHLCDDREFFTQSQYNKHMRIVHVKNQQRFRCRQCDDVAFDSLREKWDHAWETHRERRIKADCPICHRPFRKYAEVRNHAKRDHHVDLSFYNIRTSSGDPASPNSKYCRIKKKQKETLIIPATLLDDTS